MLTHSRNLSAIESPTSELIKTVLNHGVTNAEAMFKSKCDLWFDSGVFKKILIKARENNYEEILESMEALAHQYISEKINNREWNRVVLVYVELGRYYANFQEYLLVKMLLEYALYYSKKTEFKSGPTLNSLGIARELSRFCIEHLKAIEISEPDKITKWNHLHAIKYLLQELLSILEYIQLTSNNAQDRQLFLQYQLQYADNYHLLAKCYSNKSQLIADNPVAYIEGEESAVSQLMLDNYRYAYIHADIASSIMQSADFDRDDENISKMLAAIIETLEDINNKRSSLEKKSTIKDFESKSYLNTRLFNLVSDRNKSVVEIRNFIDEHKIDVNVADDSKRVNKDVKESNTLEPKVTVLDHIVGTGRADVFNLMFDYQVMHFSLFSTESRYGMAHYINELSMCETLEVLLNPNLSGYRNHPEYPLLKFYIDAMAGRVEEVHSYISNNPDNIIKIPKSMYPNEEPGNPFVLHMAYHCKQKGVIRFLENFIEDYIKNNSILAKIETLKILYQNLANCYIHFGWNAKRRLLVDGLMNKCMHIYQDMIDQINKASDQESSAAKQNIMFYEGQKIELMFNKAEQYEAEGDRTSTQDADRLYRLSKQQYELIFQIYKNYNHFYGYISQGESDPLTLLDLIMECSGRVESKLIKLNEGVLKQINTEQPELYDGSAVSDNEQENESQSSSVKAAEEKTQKKKSPVVFALPPHFKRAIGGANLFHSSSPRSSPNSATKALPLTRPASSSKL